MNRNAAAWFAGALAVLALAAAEVILGFSLLPTGMAAQKAGTFVPWLFTWGLIWATAVIAVVIASFLIVTGASQDRLS